MRTRAQDKQVLKAHDYVGTYGCQAANRIVKVGWSGVRGHKDSGPMGRDQLSIDRPKRPIETHLDCPGCGNNHFVKFMWRQRKEGEEVELEL